MKDLSNKAVLITGAGSGIGRLMAIEFASRGSNLILWDIRLDLIEETKKLVLATPKVRKDTSVILQQCDLSKKDAIYTAADALLVTHPEGPDVLGKTTY
jgi:all-trans-retinol dehydrogenase (NAD+)